MNTATYKAHEPKTRRRGPPTPGVGSWWLLQRKCACGGTPGPSGECEECRKKRLQRKASQLSTHDSHTSEIPPIVHEVVASPGQPLDLETRAFMESRFGHDFGGVRVHTDTLAAASARMVNAQ